MPDNDGGAVLCCAAGICCKAGSHEQVAAMATVLCTCGWGPEDSAKLAKALGESGLILAPATLTAAFHDLVSHVKEA